MGIKIAMPDRTIQQLLAYTTAIRSNEYELSPDSNHGREVHYNGKKIGTVFKINVEEEPESEARWQYLALALRANSRGEVHTRSLGNHDTPEEAFEVIKNLHSRNQ